MTSTTPPLKWAGGKRWLIPQLQELWQSHTDQRLVEPFVGGMAVSLGLNPSQALLNDINPHLINFYRWIKKGLVINIPLKNDKNTYYQHRERFNQLIECGDYYTAEAASLFYYLNRTGFNGLCRFNKSGYFNVPFGKYATITYTRDFSAYAKVVARWELRHGDFSDILVQPTDVIYADPPYDVDFTSYSAGGFDWDAQVAVARWLANHPGPVIASNQATPRILELYRELGFVCVTIAAPRRISCDGNRTPALEMFATRGIRLQVKDALAPTLFDLAAA